MIVSIYYPLKPSLLHVSNCFICYYLLDSTPNSVLEVHDHPEESDLVVKANQVVLGPYTDVKPLEHGIFEIQYELPGTVSHVRHLRRDIEVSQWGNNLAIEEHINFVNNGAQ